ncbi:MAG: PatB family C-S lyase [Campylobacterota bacterium]|nr:PatB family C-S lyase [Campylobacterota bacterium]
MAFESIAKSREKSEKYQLRQELFGTTDVTPMWVADMDIPTCKEIVDALHVRVENGYFGYEMMPNSAYAAQIRWMKKRHNLELKREEMLSSPSVVASMSMCIEALSEVGDEIIVFTPVYPPFFHSVSRLKRRVSKCSLVQNKSGIYEINFEELEEKAKSAKMILLCSPHNPVGRVWTKDELEKIADIATKNSLIVMSDEVHCDLVNPNFKHIPFASISSDAREICVTLLGVGKTFNLSGLALSTMSIASKTIFEKVKIRYEKTHFGEGNVLSNVAFEVAFSECEYWLDETLHVLHVNYEMLNEVLEKHSSLIKLTPAQGTYLAWLDCSQMKLSNKKLRNFFVNDVKLGLSAGISFGKEGDKFMRLNYAVPTELMRDVVDRLDVALSAFSTHPHLLETF